MKIELKDDKIILYLYDYFFENNDKKKILTEIKNIFAKLIECYHIDIKGMYDVNAYENKRYGTVLEIISKEQLLFHPELVDIKLKFYKDANFYLKTKDYFNFSKLKKIYFDNNYYYQNIDNYNNIINLIEFTDLIYNEKDINFNKMKLIK